MSYPPLSNSSQYLQTRLGLRVGVLDDHPATTIGVAGYIERQPGLIMIEHHLDAETFLTHLSEQVCDVVIVDFSMPGGVDGVPFIRRLRARFPNLGIVIYSALREIDVEYPAYMGGANAFISKNQPLSLLVQALRLSQSGKGFFAVRGGRVVETKPVSPESKLTIAERETLRHIAAGLSVTQICAKLNRTKQTVSSHKRHAMTKLELSDDRALALYLEKNFKE